ncbi:MAG: sensor domain-containing diguanylate cyclase [Treponema sp.]|nr:sensor domain-containing diguanylate cyclase [Treponema sp.]
MAATGKKNLIHVLNKLQYRDNIVILFVFLFLLILFSFIIINESRSSMHTRRLEAESLAVVYGSQIERNCTKTFQLNETIASLLIIDNSFIDNFMLIAERIISEYPAADCVQLAPDGVVEQVYPLEGNESVLGHNLFTDKNRSDEAILAKKTGMFSIGGPYPLLQGGEGFIGRYPVFLDSEKTKFWGFVNVVSKLSSLTESVNLPTLITHGYLYSVYRIAPSGEIFHISGSEFSSLHDPVRHQLDIPNAHWELAIAPRGLWINIHFIIILTTLSLVIISAFTILTFLFFRLRKSNMKLAQLASLDQLTGLYSKQTALFTLKKEIDYAERNGTTVAVCFIDMNNFKQINDTYGHTTGDAALIKVAKRITESVRNEDIVARFGGDEFLIIFRGKNSGNEYLNSIERIKEALNVPAKMGGHGIADISAAIGLAIYPRDGKSAEELINFADSRMYDTKARMKVGLE